MSRCSEDLHNSGFSCEAVHKKIKSIELGMIMQALVKDFGILYVSVSKLKILQRLKLGRILHFPYIIYYCLDVSEVRFLLTAFNLFSRKKNQIQIYIFLLILRLASVYEIQPHI